MISVGTICVRAFVKRPLKKILRLVETKKKQRIFVTDIPYNKVVCSCKAHGMSEGYKFRSSKVQSEFFHGYTKTMTTKTMMRYAHR